MAVKLEGTRTEKNLKEAFAGESMARNRYTFFASAAAGGSQAAGEAGWRRSREPRFGRSDERRTYVKSALLLAVALQQQRRRTGTAERLRQLEVLTFRTRVRRTLDARSGRGAAPLDELTLPA